MMAKGRDSTHMPAPTAGGVRMAQIIPLLGFSVLLLLKMSFDITQKFDPRMMTAATQAPTQSIAFQQIEKPQLIIHIGPPKTATTTIQETLTTQEWQDILRMDNYVYSGVFLSPGSEKRPVLQANRRVKDFDCSRSMSTARRSFLQNRVGTNNTTLAQALRDVPCARSMLDALEEHRVAGQSLIISDESLGFKANKYDGIEGKVSLDWISLAVLLQPDWDVHVLVVYRRYFDWLPSSKQQVERWTPRKPKMNKWTASGGKVPGPLFPDFWQIAPGHSKLPYFFADTLVESTQSHLPVILVNLHKPGFSARSLFICDGLVGAAISCRKSREKDNIESEEKKANPTATTMYDSLVMAADGAGMIHHKDDTIKRRDVALQALSHHRDVLNGREFPVVCPEQLQYEAFLNKSLALERRVLPDFAAHAEDQHREEFWRAVRKQKFCHIDTKKILADPQWATFFRSI